MTHRRHSFNGGALILAFLFCLSLPATANDCMLPLSAEEAKAARSVFVFQVMSADYRRGAESPLGDFVVARLRLVDKIRGKSAATHMAYYLSVACGPKIVPGSYYAAFLPKESRSFLGSTANLVAIGKTYSPSQDRPVLVVLSVGGASAEEILKESRQSLSQVPPPPTPCPLSNRSPRL